MAQLRIYKDSWHYRYWSFLRDLWGCGDLPNMTSLCPYCQTILWLSVVTVLFSPAFLLGWLLAKFLRWLYKVAAKAEKHGQLGHRFVDTCDRLKIGEGLEKVGEKMTESPAIAGVCFLFGCFACVFIMVAFILIAIIGVGKFIWNLPWIIGWCGYGIYWAVTEFGWLIVWLLSWVGRGLVVAAAWAAWLFTNGALWATIGKWALAIVITMVLCVVVCYVVTAILTSKKAKRFWEWVSFQFNGFVEARDDASKRRVEQAIVIKERIEKGELPQPKPSKIGRYWGTVSDGAVFIVAGGFKAGCVAGNRVIDTFMDFFVSGEEIDEQGQVKKILSPVRIVWEYLVAFKHGVCPIVEFKEPAKPEPEPKPEKDGSSFGGSAEVEVNTEMEADHKEKIGGEADASVSTEAETNASKEIGGEAEAEVK